MQKNIITTRFTNIYQTKFKVLNSKENLLETVKVSKAISFNRRIQKKLKKEKLFQVHPPKQLIDSIEQMH
jgi:hypothetical protein